MPASSEVIKPLSLLPSQTSPESTGVPRGRHQPAELTSESRGKWGEKEERGEGGRKEGGRQGWEGRGLEGNREGAKQPAHRGYLQTVSED